MSAKEWLIQRGDTTYVFWRHRYGTWHVVRTSNEAVGEYIASVPAFENTDKRTGS